MTNLTFRWRYVLLPLVILFLSIVLAAGFYNLLPAEVAYRFNDDGSAQSCLGRGLIVLLMLLPQLLLTLTALGITWGAARVSRSVGQIENWLKVERVLIVMGNMVTLPQIVLGFVMLDIFSYNVYNMHLIPIWIFAPLVMALGGVVLAVLFIRAMRSSKETLP